jgi:TonB family protein
MTYSSFTTSSATPSPGREVVGVPAPAEPEAASRSDAMALLGVLRQRVSSGTHTPDAIFRAVMDAARVLTGAGGTALALEHEGSVTCRASSGDIAPPPGSRMDVHSGISGECFRTGKSLRCDDAQTDERVDPEVCGQLGVRSILVVPVRSGKAAVGILEAFSARPYAFGQEHISFLERLAEVAEAAYEAQKPNDQKEKDQKEPIVEPARPPEFRRSFIRPELFESESADSEVLAGDVFGETSLAARLRSAISSKHKLRYAIMGAVAVLLVLASLVAWLSWREPESEVVANAHAKPTRPQPAPEPSVARDAPAVFPFKPAAGHPRADRAPAVLLQKASRVETAEVIVSKDKPAGVSSNIPSSPAKPSPQAAAEAAPEPPAPALSYASPETSGSVGKLIAANAPPLPALNVRVSQGVTEAVLLRKVQPIYPAAARAQRLEGSVVLQATIAEDGSPSSITVMSGAPLLAHAVVDAVRQWRFTPALLNGKPVAIQKQITVVFRAP